MAELAGPRGTVRKSAVDARSGVTGNGVRYVLGWGTFGVVVAFILVYFAFFR